MEIAVSFDYEDFIEEIEGDLQGGLITLDEPIKIVRFHKTIIENYYPIIDYYYNDDYCDEPFTEMLVQDVLKEMREWKRIL